MAEQEIIYNDLIVEENQEVVTVEEIMPAIEVTEVESFEIEMQEAFPALQTDTNYNHALLNNREIRDAHPITAITGLREELDSIEALKTVYSDKKGSADYYEWADRNELAQSRIGYFVTLNRDINTISVCTGDDIFGVVVDRAAFVGGQDDAIRDSRYGLVATSGVVLVRCELDVAEGDYVVSNAYGLAKKSTSNSGYRVEALHDIGGVPHATIKLNISADQINLMGAKLQNLDDRVDANYKNIIAAVNTANQAYNRANDVAISNQDVVNKVNDATVKVDGITTEVVNISDQVVRATLISSQAQAIANSAVTFAETAKNEAANKANAAWTEAVGLRENFRLMENQITDVNNQVTIVTKQVGDQGAAISGIRSEVKDHEARIESLTSWQGKTNSSMARVEQKADANGAYIQSTVSNLDKYTVGPHSQAYGFTLEQAAIVLESDMYYVPTEQATEEYILTNEAVEWTDDDKDISKVYYVVDDEGVKTYKYWGDNHSDYDWVESASIPTYTRTFVPHYLYKWGRINTNGPYGWTTVDKFYNPIKYDETDSPNTSAQAVYFQTTAAPVIASSDNFGYWYTDGNTLTGTAESYEPYTLYKWTTYITKQDDGKDISDNSWIPVATLAGNVNNRLISQIRQDANSISLEVVNARGSVASLTERITDTESDIQSLAAWTKDDQGNQYNLATIQQKASNAEANIALVVQEKDGEKVVNGASIVAAINSQTGDSFVGIEAKYVNLKGQVTFESFDKETIDKIEADSIDVQIWSSRGNIFKRGDATTILTCHVFRAGVDITSTLPNSAFAWEKINNDGTKDEKWIATPYGNNANAIQITSGDVWSRAMFNCAVTL